MAVRKRGGRGREGDREEGAGEREREGMGRMGGREGRKEVFRKERKGGKERERKMEREGENIKGRT